MTATIMRMQRFGLRIGVLLLTFVCGIAVNSFVGRFFQPHRERSCFLQVRNMPRFVSVGSLLDSDYHIYRYRTPTSTDPEQIVLYGDFRSAEVTEYHFEANATPSDGLIELSSKLNVTGQRERRGVRVFEGGSPVRIFWTEGDVFWSVQAPTLELAREFEQSEIVRSITRVNNRVKQTR